MIDFNSGTELPNKFLGSEKKTTLLYNNEIYMIKFPDPIRDKNNTLSYMNNQFSEHIGCRIFRVCGLSAQETILGAYTDKTGRKKIVVGCKDFTQDGTTLYECSKLANAIVTVDEKIKATIENVRLIIQETDFIKDKTGATTQFWDMFVVDALLGNNDRHLDNWGFLSKDNEFSPAPVYDCGSSLGALLSDDQMRRLLDDEIEFNSIEYNTKSCYSLNGQRIFYHKIFKTPPNELNEAIRRITPRIDLELVKETVLSTEGISDIRKEYLIKSLTVRYERILAPALKQILKRQG
ncbi:MAG: HipA domain-containing protein [Gracilibacteraceae bacterium]|nr:HipA domain-containing protein [Gracilibacteraceae bacterium]